MWCSTGLTSFGPASTQLYNGDRKVERSVSSHDVPHVFRFSYNWDLPFGRGKRFAPSAGRLLDALIGGWKMGGIATLRSGQPWQVELGSGNAGFPNDYGQVRPDIIPGVPLVNPDWDKVKGFLNASYLNPKAFAAPARFTLGTAPRTLPYVRYPFRREFNMSLLKDVQLQERARLQLRAEMFNVLNHTNFAGNTNNRELYDSLDYVNYTNPVSRVVPAFSTTSNNAGPQRVIQLGLKVIF
jgi:hypothetical protein